MWCTQIRNLTQCVDLVARPNILALYDIKMTLTAPGCPVAQSFPDDIEAKVATVPNVSEVKVELVWEPTWSRDMMSEAAQRQLGMF